MYENEIKEAVNHFNESDVSAIVILFLAYHPSLVSVKVTNTGKVQGEEVVQLYIDDIESTVSTPPMLLKGFRRISLDADETKTVSFKLNYDTFKLVNLNYEWAVEPGDFRILIGAASDDIRYEKIITL
jgi:beta-glucosidase